MLSVYHRGVVRSVFRQENDKNRITKHHLTPKKRGGLGRDPTNILLLKHDDHHHQWHILFGIQTLEETIIMLLEFAQPPNKDFLEFFFADLKQRKYERRKNAWKKLFGVHSLKEVIDRLIRLRRWKCRKAYQRKISQLYDKAFGEKQVRPSFKGTRRERQPHRPYRAQFAPKNCRA